MPIRTGYGQKERNHPLMKYYFDHNKLDEFSTLPIFQFLSNSVDFDLNFLVNKGVPKPDYMFPGLLLDEFYTNEHNLTLPLKNYTSVDITSKEKVKEKQYYYKNPGIYVWYEPYCNTIDEITEILYVGKAINLKQRLLQHWKLQRSSFLHDYFRDRLDTNQLCCPHIAIWEGSNSAHLESNLIKILSPTYNKQINV
jgi:hypothetical protein